MTISFKGLTKEHIQEIIKHTIGDMPTDEKKINIALVKMSPNPYNNFASNQKLKINIPISDKDGKFQDWMNFEIHIHDDGYYRYDNGSGCEMKAHNSLEIYKIISNNFDLKLPIKF